ncbi:MAG: hypothetical protein KC591_05890, partial [Gemmatimonadetes bacterium]|nr:hypothetical protein [Gemmatimonadota bacterium]
MKRVLLYAHDAVGLGHIRRVCRIADGLARLHGDVTTLVLSGSSVADALPFPEGSDVVKLPSLRKYHNGAYGARHLHVDDKSIVRMRTAMIGAAFRTFEPDLVIVDKVASGVHGELVPALRTLRRLNPNAQIVLSLRDILDDPASVRRGWAKDGTLDTIRELYDRVFVWGMPEICDVVTEYSMPEDIAAKVEYCGYLASEDRDGETSPKKSPTRKRLVVTTVGGGEDGGRILSTFVKSLAHTHESFASVVVMGPDLPEQTRSEIRRLVQHSTRPVFAVDFTRHLDRLFDACDLVVSMGGYNTM